MRRIDWPSRALRKALPRTHAPKNDRPKHSSKNHQKCLACRSLEHTTQRDRGENGCVCVCVDRFTSEACPKESDGCRETKPNGLRGQTQCCQCTLRMMSATKSCKTNTR